MRHVILGTVAALVIWSAEPLLAADPSRHSTVIAQSEATIPAKPRPHNPSPPYPEQALEAGVEGSCVFRADVTPEGTVAKVSVLRVPKEGLGFEAAVEKAVAAWQFEPARRGGAKTASIYLGKINFSLLSVNHGRMYSVSASAAWKKLLEWLADKKIRTKNVDAAHQLVFTEPIDLRNGLVPLPATMGDDYAPRRVQIQVFVSPYAEPARVYVASLIEAERQSGSGTEKLTVYNSPIPSTWLLREFSKYLGDPGHAMPDTTAARAALASQLRPDLSASVCTPNPLRTVPTSPVKFFDLSPVFPARMLAAGRRGEVQYKFLIEEDGSTTFSGFIDSPASSPGLARAAAGEQPFLDAARAVLAFWRFEPIRVAGCPAVIVANAEVTFK